MAEPENRKSRRDGVRASLKHRRAARRAQRRMNADAGSENAGFGLGQRLQWTLREFGWGVQERLLWPATDWLRAGLGAVAWPFERAAWELRKNFFWRIQDQLSSPGAGSGKVPRAATLGALGAIALGALGAGALVASDGGDTSPAKPQPVLVAQAEEQTEDEAEQLTPIVARTEPKADQPALKGVRPSFGSRSDEERAEARAALRKLKSEQKEPAGDKANATGAAAESGTDAAGKDVAGDPADSGSTGSATTGENGSAKTSDDSDTSESSAVVSNVNPKKVRRQESPLNVAERFAMAFVSYEVGASGQPIEAAFKDTTDSDLFNSLTDRPPRQPTGGKVPKARVVNVVGGPRKKNAMEVSVGLLRVDGISEIRLDMKRLGRGWVVKTVRG